MQDRYQVQGADLEFWLPWRVRQEIRRPGPVWFTERGQGYPEQNCETLFQMKSKTMSAIGLHNRAVA